MSGLPRSLKAGRSSKVTVRVRDAYGVPAGDVAVTAKGAGIRVSGRTDPRGRVTLLLKPVSRGNVTVSARAPGSREVTGIAAAR